MKDFLVGKNQFLLLLRQNATITIFSAKLLIGKHSLGFREVFCKYFLCFYNPVFFKFSFIVIHVVEEIIEVCVVFLVGKTELSEEFVANGLVSHDVFIGVTLQRVL